MPGDYKARVGEAINSFRADSINTCILCLSEHHIKKKRICSTAHSASWSSFWQQNLQVWFFYQHFSHTDTSHHYKENDLETCAIEIHVKALDMITSWRDNIKPYRTTWRDLYQSINTL